MLAKRSIEWKFRILFWWAESSFPT